MPSERAASSNEFLVHYSPECVEKLFDNSKLFLVWAPTSEQKRLKRSHFVVLTATGSRSEGLQRFIKQFLEEEFCEIRTAPALCGALFLCKGQGDVLTHT